MSARTTECWILGWPTARRTAELAGRLEAAGWDGLLLPDTQCLASDSYIQLAMCGAATSRLKLGTGVTNPVTRDASVVASAIATLQEETGGRVSLGIGRGDSSLAYIGQEPARLGVLRSFLVDLQTYLRGEFVDREGFASSVRCVRESAQPKVPVDVSGTGPKILDMAAQYADGITLAVGAYPERIARKVADVEAALAKHSRNRADFAISVYVNCVVNEDRAAARDLARGTAATLARFNGMGPVAAADLSEADQYTVAILFAEYDMNHHASCKAAHAKNLPDDFLDRFAVLGEAEEVGNRLETILQAPIDRLVLIAASPGAEPSLVEQNVARLSQDVLPRLKAR
jgi:5,10-methylenetetrahydromethanopterin reductase